MQEEYRCSVRPLYQNSNVYEGLFIDVFSDKLLKKITLGNIYRPPKRNNSNSEVNKFIEEISPIIDCLSRENSQLCLSGDFNINLLEINNRESYQDYLDVFVTNSLYPQISYPTRFATRRATLIDQIFCKARDEIMRVNQP